MSRMVMRKPKWGPTVYLSESFPYADQAGWGSNFTMFSYNSSTGRVAGGMPSSRAVSANTSKLAEWGRSNQQAGSDDQILEFRYTSTGTVNTADEMVVALRCDSSTDSNANNGVWLVFQSGSAYIFTTIAGTQTQRSTATYSFSYGTMLEFSIVGNLYQLKRMDTGAVVVGWNDASSAVARGLNYRYLKLALTTNRPIFGAQQYSPTVDDLVWKSAA